MNYRIWYSTESFADFIIANTELKNKTTDNFESGYLMKINGDLFSYISCMITVRDLINQNLTRKQLTERIEFCQQLYDECISDDFPQAAKHKAKEMLEVAKGALISFDKYLYLLVKSL